MAKQTPRSYLLVHDAWQGSACWDAVIPLLTAEGHAAQAVDLPSGADADLARWTAAIGTAVERSASPVVLVGHGSAGMAITAAAETLHPRLAALAYVAAMVPRDGESFLDLAARDPDSALLPRLDVDAEQGLVRLPDDAAGPEDRSMQRQAVAQLAALERGLPRRQREVFRLRFYAELELDEIAASLGVHVGTVKTQLHRAVHRLRRELGDVR